MDSKKKVYIAFFFFFLSLLVTFFLLKSLQKKSYSYSNILFVVHEKESPLMVFILSFEKDRGKLGIVGIPHNFCYENECGYSILKKDGYRDFFRFVKSFSPFEFDGYVFVDLSFWEKVVDLLGCFPFYFVYGLDTELGHIDRGENLICGDIFRYVVTSDFSEFSEYRRLDYFVSMVYNYLEKRSILNKDKIPLPLESQKVQKEVYNALYTNLGFEDFLYYIDFFSNLDIKNISYSLLTGVKDGDNIVLSSPKEKLSKFFNHLLHPHLKKDEVKYIKVQVLNGTFIPGLAKRYRYKILSFNDFLVSRKKLFRYKVLEFGNAKEKNFQYTILLRRQDIDLGFNYLAEKLKVKYVYTLLDFSSFFDYTVILGYDRGKK